MSIHLPDKYPIVIPDTVQCYREAAMLLLNKMVCVDDVYGAMVHGSLCNTDLQDAPLPNDIDLLVRTRNSGNVRVLRKAAQETANIAGITVDLAAISGETPRCNPFFVSGLQQSSLRHRAWTRGNPLYGMRAVDDYPTAEQLPTARDSIVNAYTTTRLRLLEASQGSCDRVDPVTLERSLRLPRSMARNGLELIRLSEGEDFMTVTNMPTNQLMEEFTTSFPLSDEAIDDLNQLRSLDEQRKLLAPGSEHEMWARDNETEIIGAAFTVIESALPVFQAVA